ncbi:XRE family transcriptional regulator [Variovorax humicola]|uniref:XRE family transcriptional regulator n=1 Tax=Variovorax humicola TaxID=1769758 RepID=A0ABU8VS06_9BURK
MLITPPVTDYRAPTPKDLQELKEHFGLTAYEMARMFAAQPEQWRKHTGGQSPREISATRAFFMAAFQVLSDEEIERSSAWWRTWRASARAGTWTRSYHRAPSRATASATKPPEA